jgi:hypothetical protein
MLSSEGEKPRRESGGHPTPAPIPRTSGPGADALYPNCEFGFPSQRSRTRLGLLLFGCIFSGRSIVSDSF